MAATTHLRITGRVQGVGYRYHMVRTAEQAGITGWVRNRSDGSVEAVISGSAEALDTVITWARRGPPNAQVTDVEITEVSGSFEAFTMLPTE
jgi:acylphosphatase